MVSFPASKASLLPLSPELSDWVGILDEGVNLLLPLIIYPKALMIVSAPITSLMCQFFHLFPSILGTNLFVCCAITASTQINK